MDFKSRFDEFFKRVGGIAPDDTEMLSFIQRVNNEIVYLRNIYPKLPDIYFNIIDNEALNATAGKDHDGLYFIGFNRGLVDGIKDIFWKIQLYKNVKTSDEIQISLLKVGKMVFYDRKNNLPTYPDVKVNPFQVYLRTDFVYKFLIYHEVCHILRGHVDYVKEKFNAVITENEEQISPERINLMQTLEMDADSFAISRLFNHYLEEYTSMAGLSVTFEKDLLQYMYDLIYPIFAFFKVFDLSNLNLNEDKNDKHHHPSMRFYFLLENIIDYIKHYKLPIDDDKISETFVRAVAESDIDFCKISFFNFDGVTLFENAMTDEFREYRCHIIKNWSELYDGLSKYAYGYLPKNNLNNP